MNKKIDYGKILFVKYFLINKKSTVATLLQKTHEQCLKKLEDSKGLIFLPVVLPLRLYF